MKEPDSTAVRVALWRALHVEIDPPPHVFEDEIGLKLAAPGDDWRRRPDMDPGFTKIFRASIVSRARFIEDLVVEQASLGVNQYVILGAGLDTFAQRRPEIASRLQVFEVDKPGPQAWKKEMLAMARKAGFKDANIVSATQHAQRYFVGRTDGLKPSNSEQMLVAST